MQLNRSMLLISWMGMWVFAAAPVSAQEKEKDEVEVLARGPVHEAYAEPHAANPTPSPVLNEKPPDPIEELPPDQKPEGENVQWIPGYWSWDDERKDFVWVSGFWRIPPPNRIWMPGSWRKIGEGYQWVPGFWSEPTPVDPQGNIPAQPQAQIEYLPEPPISLETGPATPAPSEEAIYVPGSWVYRQRYVWRPGYWINHRPGWVWVPSCYRWSPAGYVFVSGYWDYALVNRGLLFAPCYIPRPIWARPTFVYTPTIVVREQCMFGALFVRRGFSSYYFGDYFGPRYVQAGFTAWCGGGVSVGVTVGRGFYDPLFSYYRVNHRNDPYWNRGISDLYVGRHKGLIAAPPRTLVQQNVVVNNITNNKTIINNNTTINNVNNVTMLSSLRNVQTDKSVKLQSVNADVMRDQVRSARQIQAVATQRSQLEAKLTPKSPVALKTDAPKSVKVDIPKPVVARSQLSSNQVPPQPKNFDPKLSRTPLNTPKADPKSPSPIVNPKGNPTPINPPKVDPKSPLPKVEMKGNPTPKIDPKLPTPKVDPKLPPPRTKGELNPNITPKVDPKLPSPMPKVQPKGNPTPINTPKVDPKLPPPIPKVEPKKLPNPVVTPKVEPKLPPPTPKVIPKGNPTPINTPKVEPKLPPPTPKVVPKVDPKPIQIPNPPKVNTNPPTNIPRVNPPTNIPRTNPPSLPKIQPKTPPPMNQPKKNRSSVESPMIVPRNTGTPSVISNPRPSENRITPNIQPKVSPPVNRPTQPPRVVPNNPTPKTIISNPRPTPRTITQPPVNRPAVKNVPRTITAPPKSRPPVTRSNIQSPPPKGGKKR